MVPNPRLDGIAHDLMHGTAGGFLKSFAETWLRADPGNRALLRPVFDKLVEKYRLGGSS